MKTTSGKIIKYTDKDGNEQKGVVRYSDQTEVLQKSKKLFIRLLDDKLLPKKDGNNKEIISIRHPSEVTVIGYVD